MSILKLRSKSLLYLLLGIPIVSLPGCSPPRVVRELEYAIDSDSQTVSEEIDSGVLLKIAERRLPQTARAKIGANGNLIVHILDTASVEDHRRIPKMFVWQQAKLEFRILASPEMKDDDALIALAKKTESMEVILDGKPIARWTNFDTRRIDDEHLKSPVRKSPIDLQPQVLVLLDKHNVTGEMLSSCSAGVDAVGNPTLNFQLNSKGSEYFAILTTQHAPTPSIHFRRQLGIIVNDILISAPFLNEPIVGGQGQITGSFSMAEVNDLANTLSLGSLPSSGLRLVDDRSIEAKP